MIQAEFNSIPNPFMRMMLAFVIHLTSEETPLVRPTSYIDRYCEEKLYNAIYVIILFRYNFHGNTFLFLLSLCVNLPQWPEMKNVKIIPFNIIRVREKASAAIFHNNSNLWIIIYQIIIINNPPVHD